MCLAVLGKVLAVDGLVATVDFFGVTRSVRLDLIGEPVSTGDYVLNHAGYALRRLAQGEAEETLALYDELQKAAEREG